MCADLAEEYGGRLENAGTAVQRLLQPVQQSEVSALVQIAVYKDFECSGLLGLSLSSLRLLSQTSLRGQNRILNEVRFSEPFRGLKFLESTQNLILSYLTFKLTVS